MGLSPQITNLVIILIFMQASKSIPFTDPFVLNLVRGIYILSNLIMGGLYFFLQMKIDKKRDMTTLKYVEPAAMGSQEEPKLVTTTVHAYDSQKVKEAVKAQLMGVGMMGVMHLYMKYTNPLCIQSVIPLKGALENNLVKIHLFGQPATGELKRPFKAGGGGFMAAMQGGGAEIKTDKASIEAAERAGRGGAKEE